MVCQGLCVCFPQRLLHSQSKPFPLLRCPAMLPALFLLLRHSFRWLSFSISRDTMGGHQCPKGDTFCSSPHRLRLLVHRTERGEGSRQHILSLSQGLLLPLPSHTPQWRLFQDVPNLFCEHPLGFMEKKPPKELGLPLCPNTRALHGPARNTWPPATHQASELNSHYLCPTYTNQGSNVLSLQYLSLPRVQATWVP